MKLHSPSEVTWSPGASFWVSWLPLLQVHAVQNCRSYLISLRKFSLGVGLTLQRQRKEIKRNLVLDITGLWQKKKTNPKPRTTNNLCGVHLILANWARHSPLLPETIWNRFPGPSNIKACWYPVHVQGPMSQAPQNPEGGQTRLLPQIKQNTRKERSLAKNAKIPTIFAPEPLPPLLRLPECRAGKENYFKANLLQSLLV